MSGDGFNGTESAPSRRASTVAKIHRRGYPRSTCGAEESDFLSASPEVRTFALDTIVNAIKDGYLGSLYNSIRDIIGVMCFSQVAVHHLEMPLCTVKTHHHGWTQKNSLRRFQASGIYCHLSSQHRILPASEHGLRHQANPVPRPQLTNPFLHLRFTVVMVPVISDPIARSFFLFPGRSGPPHLMRPRL